jgi:hypothetical protein
LIEGQLRRHENCYFGALCMDNGARLQKSIEAREPVEVTFNMPSEWVKEYSATPAAAVKKA